MKKVFILSIVVLFTMFLTSCVGGNKKLYNDILGGKHELRKFNVNTNTSTSSSGWYFIVLGGYSSTTSSSSIVRFYFLNYKDEYQLMEKSLTDVNIKIDSTAIKPYVKFYWTRNAQRDSSDIFRMYDYDVTKVVIYCKDSDFQPDININNLK